MQSPAHPIGVTRKQMNKGIVLIEILSNFSCGTQSLCSLGKFRHGCSTVCTSTQVHMYLGVYKSMMLGKLQRHSLPRYLTYIPCHSHHYQNLG